MAVPLVPSLVLALASIQAAADAGAPVGVSVGMGATSFQHIWKRSVGSGHALLGTRADWQRHLQMVRNDLGFEGVRMHGLLDDDMSIVMQVRPPHTHTASRAHPHALPPTPSHVHPPACRNRTGARAGSRGATPSTTWTSCTTTWWASG